MIGEQVQHYRILRQLGSGGMGVVYEAEDTRLGRHVALKFLPESLVVSPDVVERFEREARIASSLNHPNICTIYDIGEDAAHGGRRFIVMELLDGESLRDRIHAQPLPLDLIVNAGCQIADALDAAHAKGIVHRDIKPANIFLTKRGQAKLLDFGVAKLGGDRHAAVASDETRRATDVLTSPGVAVGSINYMSPEQARGEELDGRTDLFSLGVVLYEMTTGRQAFSGQTTAVVFDAILNKQPPEPRLTNPEIPDELARVIQRALEKDRKLRFQTAADMLAELSRIRRDTTGRTIATSATAVIPPVAPTSPPIRSSSALWWRLGVPAAVIVLAAGFYLWNANRTPAFTERDTVVVADFTNSTGDPVFDDALRQGLLVQLQQTPYLTVLPDLRVERTLMLMQRQPDQPITPQVAREICQRVGAKATVEGSIVSLGSSYVVTLGVHNCQTGAAITEQQAQAARKEEVITKLGEAATGVRRRLGESLASIQKYDVPVTEATTSSLDALKAYGLASKTRLTRGDEASIPFFQKAIEFDPNFALAYAKLAVVCSNIGQMDDAVKYTQKAYDMRDRVSEYERLYITWNYDSRVLKDPKKELESLELMVASNPRDYAAQNNLGVYYSGRADYAEAAQHYQAAIDIAPDEPLPIKNLAFSLYFLDRRPEANAAVDRVLSIRPDGSLALIRWSAALRSGDPDAPKYELVARKMATPDDLLATEAGWAVWQGRLGEYAAKRDELIAHARATHHDDIAEQYEASSRIIAALFEGKVAELAASAPRLADPVAEAQTAMALAALGQVGEAKPMVAKLDALGKQNAGIWMPVAVAKAYERATSGLAREGAADLQEILAKSPQATYMHFHMGRLRELGSDLQGAEAEYRATIDAANVLGFDPVVTVARYSLARMLAKKGDTAAAKEQYDAMLKQWAHAETEFDWLKRVKEERKALDGK